MDKIEEIKRERSINLLDGVVHEAFYRGFDAAMELQLPVKFSKWLKNTDNGDIHYNHITKETSPSIGFSPSDCYLDDFKTEEELYKYWLENIYQPENK